MNKLRERGVRVEKLSAEDLSILTELFDYHDVQRMIAQCAREIQSRKIDIFVLFDQGMLVGELHAMYENEDVCMASRGRRAYLFAFRVRESCQGKGYGTHLMKTVLAALREDGYSEFTIGVEDDNQRAARLYQAFGFTELIARKQEAYQGDAYEYGLYLKK